MNFSLLMIGINSTKNEKISSICHGFNDILLDFPMCGSVQTPALATKELTFEALESYRKTLLR